MPNPVSLGTLIRRTRDRWNGAGDNSVTDWEIADSINVSLACELYDLVRQAVGDQYYRKAEIITLAQNVAAYDLPADHVSTISVDVWTSPVGSVVPPGTYGATTLKISARRYMEYERNLYQQFAYLIGWAVGNTVLYSLTGQQITFQPIPNQALQIQLNYVPTSPQLGGGEKTDGAGNGLGVPCSYTDTWDDINGWAELAVLDAAAKCCLKKNRPDMVMALGQRQALLRTKVASVISLRHAGEPERPNLPFGRGGGDGWLEG